MKEDIAEIKERILKMINKEKNPEKREMLHKVFYNNMPFARERESMIMLGNIIDAMCVIDRGYFAPKNEDVYVDEPLSIGHGQTISQPTTVARMLLLARLEPNLSVLEIGAGSGWNASLAAKMVYPGKVLAVERIKPISELAKNNFNAIAQSKKIDSNVEFVFSDALDRKGRAWKQKYDRIIATAGANAQLKGSLHKMGQHLLKNNGLLLYPTNEFGTCGALELWQNKNGKLARVLREDGYSFVPLLKGEEK